jgi:hypothetical protein
VGKASLGVKIVTIEEARKMLGSNQSKYSDAEIEDMMTKLRNLAEIILPKVVSKLAINATK